MRRCERGDDETLEALALNITSREEFDEVLIAIPPWKQPRQIIRMPPPTVKKHESLLVARFDGSAESIEKKDSILQKYGSCWNGLLCLMQRNRRET